ncbi:S1 family peptidase [Photobacterium kagoshimensis]|uniref:S1 family peptidase n=1 Tax=Photobacterium kagoshimensis TaxID=2910242 RepID=UPI003D0FFEBD
MYKNKIITPRSTTFSLLLLAFTATASDARPTTISAFGNEDISHSVMVPKIINGIDTPANSLPWQVSVNFICGGSIISGKWVVTAAHCVIDPDTNKIDKPNDITIFAHAENIMDNQKGKSYVVADVIVHPGYLNDYRHDDIALLKISDSIFMGGNPNTEFPDNTMIQLLSASKQVELDNLIANKWVENQKREAYLLTSGWGSTDSRKPKKSDSFILKQTLLTGVPDSVCDRDWSSLPHEKVVCTNSPDPELATDSCFGDSGGPLVWQDPSHRSDSDKGLRLVGIVSYGKRLCGTSESAVYTQVSNYIPWIKRNIGGHLPAASTFAIDPFKADYTAAPKAPVVPSSSSDDNGGSASIFSLIALCFFGIVRRGRFKLRHV